MSSVASHPTDASRRSPLFPPPQGRWTYDDYARLPDTGRRYEVIDGNLCMSPSPNWMHQRAALNLARLLADHLEPRGGRAVIAPMDLVMGDIATPVQPDVIAVGPERMGVFAESGRLEGVPDLLAEVLSPSTRGHDERVKFDAYHRAGVPEYWILDPVERTVRVHVRRGEAWVPILFRGHDTAASEVFAGFTAPVETVFA